MVPPPHLMNIIWGHYALSQQRSMDNFQTWFHKFTLHCDKASAKAMQSLGLIKRNFTHLSKEPFLMLYKTYIRPHLEYCVPIWNLYLAKNINKLERVQHIATKLLVTRFNPLTLRRKIEISRLVFTLLSQTERGLNGSLQIN